MRKVAAFINWQLFSSGTHIKFGSGGNWILSPLWSFSSSSAMPQGVSDYRPPLFGTYSGAVVFLIISQSARLSSCFPLFPTSAFVRYVLPVGTRCSIVFRLITWPKNAWQRHQRKCYHDSRMAFWNGILSTNTKYILNINEEETRLKATPLSWIWLPDYYNRLSTISSTASSPLCPCLRARSQHQLYIDISNVQK